MSSRVGEGQVAYAANPPRRSEGGRFKLVNNPDAAMSAEADRNRPFMIQMMLGTDYCYDGRG